jgi:uncharacterized membrane protein
MTISPIVYFHIWTALIGVSFGFAALAFRKGSGLHRLSGNVFFVSMLSMTVSASYLATFVKPVMINATVGVFTFYLVATAWLTVIRKNGEIGYLESGLLLLALADGVAAFIFGQEALHSVTGLKDGASATGYFVVAVLTLLFASFDVRMLVRGGASGAQRIGRHLWRMCFALLIAASSLFLGQPQLFSKAIHRTHVLWVPTIVIIVTMIFWLVRVRFAGRYTTQRKIRQPRDAGMRQVPGDLEAGAR